MTTQPQDGRRLNSWKEIATFLGRAERTVKRWEAENGLPVHRPVGKTGARIYADPAELTEWLKSSPSVAAPPVSGPVESTLRWSRLTPAVWLAVGAAFAAVAALAAGGGWLMNGHRADGGGAHDPQAVELYRQGVHDWNSRTPAGLARAEDEFTQAIVHDPNYAEAYVGLANTYNLLREYAAMPDAEAYPRAEAAARRAIALNPSLGRAHAALGFVLFYWKWDAPAAEAEFRKALTLDPRDALAHHWFANILRALRRTPEALTEIETAQGLDPDSSSILADKANILESLGRGVEARRLLRQMVALDPRFASPHSYLADFDLTPPRDFADFLVESRTAAALHADPVRTAVNQAAQAGWDRGGAPAMLAAMLKRQLDLHAKGQVTAREIARTYVLMGDRPNARLWLKKAIANHESSVPDIGADPTMRVLFDDPSFAFLRTLTRGGAAAPAS